MDMHNAVDRKNSATCGMTVMTVSMHPYPLRTLVRHVLHALLFVHRAVQALVSSGVVVPAAGMSAGKSLLCRDVNAGDRFEREVISSKAPSCLICVEAKLPACSRRCGRRHGPRQPGKKAKPD